MPQEESQADECHLRVATNPSLHWHSLSISKFTQICTSQDCCKRHTRISFCSTGSVAPSGNGWSLLPGDSEILGSTCRGFGWWVCCFCLLVCFNSFPTFNNQEILLGPVSIFCATTICCLKMLGSNSVPSRPPQERSWGIYLRHPLG